MGVVSHTHPTPIDPLYAGTAPSTYVTDTHMAHIYHADASTHTIYTSPIHTHYTYILHILLHSSHTHTIHTCQNTSPLTSHICYRHTHILPYMSHIPPHTSYSIHVPHIPSTDHILHTNSLYTYHTYIYKHTKHVTSNRSSRGSPSHHHLPPCVPHHPALSPSAWKVP